MMKFLLPLVIAGTLASGSLPAAPVVVKSVYISIRSDGLSGTGTTTDPFNGSTQLKFDALMKSFGPNTQINLSAGTFLTKGADEYGLKTGWEIEGSGMGKTVVKLVGYSSGSHKHVHFAGNGQTDSVEIRNLTCDANYQGLTWPSHDAVGGITVWGNNVLVENVEVINCYGDSVNGLEQFSILIGGDEGGNHEITQNCTIKNCWTHNYAQGSTYTNGPMISYCVKPLITSSKDDGGSHGFGFASTANAQISDCTTSAKTAKGFYTDTSTTTDLEISGNSFSSSEIPIQFNTSLLVQNVKILNNNLSSTNSTNYGSAAIVLCGGPGNNITIKGNTFIYLGKAGSGFILNNGARFKGLDVQDNSSNVGLIGYGGRTSDVINASNYLSGNKFNQPLASSPLNEWVPPSSAISSQDNGVRTHTNLRVLNVPSTDPATVSQFNTPTTLRSVYQLPSKGGSGAIAIVDSYNFPTAQVDFNKFSQNFGLPGETSSDALSMGNQTFQVVYAAGLQPPSGGDYIASWNLEAALDIEWAHAMAPNAKIYLVEAASDSINDLIYAVRVASRLPGVREVSMSWGENEVFWEAPIYDSVFTAAGVVYLAASGDSSDQMEYPAASPNVISCGGTSVNRNASGAFVSETGWNSGGCGSSAYERRPVYQAALASKIGTKRGVCDAAFDADPATGVYVYDSTPFWGESGWWMVGGTSVSSPSLAGVLNLAASSGNGFAASTAQEQGRLYANLGNARAFRDITSGTDGRFNCEVGWDFVTGVGTPQGLTGK